MREKRKRSLRINLLVILTAFCCLALSDQVKAAEVDPAIEPVKLPVGQEIIIPTSTNLSTDHNYAKLCVANNQSFPPETSYYWLIEPSTIINGLTEGMVGLTLPDGTFKNLRVTVKIAGQKQVQLKHNSYLYNQTGRRSNGWILRAGSTLNLTSSKNQKGRLCLINDHHYVAKDNIFGTKRKLNQPAQIYNQFGVPVNKKGLKKKATVRTYGVPVNISGQQMYVTAVNRYLPSRVVGSAVSKRPKATSKSAFQQQKRIMHSSYLYNQHGQRINGLILATGSRVKINKHYHSADGRLFYSIGKGYYVPVRNVTGISIEKERFANPITVYNRYAQKVGKIPANQKFQTYGNPIKVKGQHYCIVGKNKLIRSKNIYRF